MHPQPRHLPRTTRYEESDSDDGYPRPAAVHMPYTQPSWSQLAQQALDRNPDLDRLRARFGIEKIDWTPPSPAPLVMSDAEQVCATDAAEAGPKAVQAAAALRGRAEKMLLGEGEHPAASGDAKAADEATNRLIVAVNEAVAGLWKQQKAAIRQARCSPRAPVGTRMRI